MAPFAGKAFRRPFSAAHRKVPLASIDDHLVSGTERVLPYHIIPGIRKQVQQLITGGLGLRLRRKIQGRFKLEAVSVTQQLKAAPVWLVKDVLRGIDIESFYVDELMGM